MANTDNTLTLQGPTELVSVAAVAGGTISSTKANPLLINGSITLDGDTLQTDLAIGAGSSLTLLNAKPFAGSAVSIGGGSTFGSTLSLPGTQALAGAATVTFDGDGDGGGGGSIGSGKLTGDTLTINPGVTISTGLQGGTISASTLSLQGPVFAKTAGKTLAISGNWSSTGPLNLSAGALRLGGTFSTTSLAGLSQTGGTLILAGTIDNTGASYTLPGPAQLAAGSITGGSLYSATPLPVIGSAALADLALHADLALQPGVTLTYAAARPFSGNNIAVLGNSTSASTLLRFPGTHTLSGTASITFDGTGATGVDTGTSGNLTVGPGITIRTGTNSGTLGSSTASAVPITNLGTLASPTAGQTLTVYGYPLTNAGSIQASNGGNLALYNLANSPTGSVSVSGGGTATFNLSSGTSWSNTGSITADNSTLTLNGTWSNTGTLSVTGGALNLNGTALATGVINTSGTAVRLAGPLPTAGNLANSAVILASNYTTAQVASIPITGGAAHSSLTVATGSTLTNTGSTLTLSAAAPSYCLAGGTITGGTIASADNTPLTATGGSSTLSALMLAAPLLVNGGTVTLASTVTNNAPSITVNSGGILSVGAISPGSLTANPGSRLNYSGPLSGLAAASFDGATLSLSSQSVTTANVRALTATNSTFLLGASLALDNTADDLTLPAGNTFALAGGKITGGTVASTLTAVSSVSTLDSTTLAGRLNIAGSPPSTATVTATNAFSLAGGSIHFTSNGSLALATNSLTGTGEVVFDNTTTSTATVRGAASLTIGPGITVRTGSVPNSTGTVGSAGAPLVNQGTISAQTPGSILNVAYSTLANIGTIEARNNGIIRLTPLTSVVSTASIPDVITSAGGAYFMAGRINNTGATLSISAAHAFGIGTSAGAGSVVTGGSVVTPDDTPFAVYAGSTNATASATLSGVDVDAPVLLMPGTRLTVTNSTIRRTVTASGATLTFASAPMPPSVILADGSTLNVNNTPTSTTAGSISLTNSIANLNAPLAASQLATTLFRTNSPLNIFAPYDNAGAVLPLDASTGPVVLAYSSGTNVGSITGGTVGSGAGGTLVLNAPTAIPFLTGVTLAADVTTSRGTRAEFHNTVTLADSHVSIGGAPGTTNTGFITNALTVQSLAGTGEISLDGNDGDAVQFSQSGSASAIPSGITIRTGTQGGTVYVGTVAGTISAQTPGKTLSLNPAKVTGTVEARDGGTLVLNPYFQNLTGSNTAYTLSGGTWNVYDGSTVAFSFGNTSIATNAAAITLSGPTSRFEALNSLTTNSGSLSLIAGRSFTTAGAFYNIGTVTVGPSSTLKVRGPLTNAGTLELTSLTCALLVDYSGASPIDTLRNDLLTSHLMTTLPNKAIAYFEASQLNLTTYAGLSVDPTTLLTRLTLTGDANLDGQITPDDYALLDRSFARQTPGAHWTDGDFNYDGQITSADYLAIDTSLGFQSGGELAPSLLSQREAQFGPQYVAELITAVPEPSILGVVGVGPAMCYRRRSRRRYM